MFEASHSQQESLISKTTITELRGQLQHLMTQKLIKQLAKRGLSMVTFITGNK